MCIWDSYVYQVFFVFLLMKVISGRLKGIIIIIITAWSFGKGWKLPAPPNHNRVTITDTLSLDVTRLIISNQMSSYLVAIDPRFFPHRPPRPS
jgi:hypothetical protein